MHSFRGSSQENAFIQRILPEERPCQWNHI
jgi:hypothetical protein